MKNWLSSETMSKDSKSKFIYILFFFIFFSKDILAAKVKIQILSSPNKENISLNLDGSYNINFFSLANPYRLVADLKKITLSKNSLKIEKFNSIFLKKIRFGNPKKNFTRIVFEFNKPFIVPKIIHSNINNKYFKYKIDIDVFESTHTAFNLGKKVMYEKFGYNDVNKISKLFLDKYLVPQTRPKLQIKKDMNFSSKIINNKKSKNYTVFIDAGHGGKDPGAVSSNGTYEKNITLQASKLLKQSLSKYKDITVNLSRNNDRYLFLRERVKLAKKVKADIFISLHVDASKNKKARGISVFSLSNKASDLEAKKLALRENSSDLIGSLQIDHEDPLIVGNLIKMFQRETMNQSAELARYILYNLNEYALYSRGHRFAGFAVLKSPDIPSILIELGFLTNKIDEKNLKNRKYLRKLCDTLAISIKRYMKSNVIFN